MLELLLTLVLTAPLQGPESFPSDFAPWLLASQGELHLPEYTQHELLLAAARREKLLPSPAEVQAALSEQITRRVEHAHGGDRSAWAAELTRLGRDEPTWRLEHHANTLNQLVIERLVRARRAITEPELRSAWERRYGPDGRAASVRWIQTAVVAPTPPANATREDERALRAAAREAARERAAEVASAWRSGADFVALQTRAGSGEEPARPFRLDELTWPELVTRSVASLEVGEVSPPLAARGGWSLLQLVSSEHTPFESVREALNLTLLARPTNSGETDSLMAELTALASPAAALPAAAYEGGPLSSTLVIGRVGEQPLTLAGFTRWLLKVSGHTYLSTFFQVKIIARAAHELGFSCGPEETAARRDANLAHRIDLFYAGERERWLSELHLEGRTLAGWEREAAQRAHHDLCAEVLLIAVRVVSKEEVHAAWEKRHGPDGYDRTVRWILLTPPQPPTDLKLEAIPEWIESQMEALQTEAAGLRLRITDGGEDFAALARRRSSDPGTRQSGGLLPGVFDPRTQPVAIARAVETMKVGQVSQPVRLPGGCALFQVQRIVHTPLADVRESLRSSLQSKRPSSAELAGFVNQFCRESTR